MSQAAAALQLPLVTKRGEAVGTDALSGKVVAFFFSASWCPPCRAFTPLLRQFHSGLVNRGCAFEVVFVSQDTSAEEMRSYMAAEHGEWLSVRWDARAASKALMGQYGAVGVPWLAVVGARGELCVQPGDARRAVEMYAADPVPVFEQWAARAQLQGCTARAAQPAQQPAQCPAQYPSPYGRLPQQQERVPLSSYDKAPPPQPQYGCSQQDGVGWQQREHSPPRARGRAAATLCEHGCLITRFSTCELCDPAAGEEARLRVEGGGACVDAAPQPRAAPQKASRLCQHGCLKQYCGMCIPA